MVFLLFTLVFFRLNLISVTINNIKIKREIRQLLSLILNSELLRTREMINELPSTLVKGSSS